MARAPRVMRAYSAMHQTSESWRIALAQYTERRPEPAFPFGSPHAREVVSIGDDVHRVVTSEPERADTLATYLARMGVKS